MKQKKSQMIMLCEVVAQLVYALYPTIGKQHTDELLDKLLEVKKGNKK